VRVAWVTSLDLRAAIHASQQGSGATGSRNPACCRAGTSALAPWLRARLDDIINLQEGKP
jgi:hypothetical protein